MKKVYLLFSLITIFTFTSCNQNDEISDLSTQSKSDNGKKVNICHYDADMDIWKTINVSNNAVDAHLAHGDYEGECSDGNDCEPDFYQGFETDYEGWFGYGNPLTLNGGYAILAPNKSFYTEFGGHRYIWEGNWSTELDVYLDPNWSSSQGFEYSVVINRTNGQALRSYVYHVNKDESTGKLLLGVDNAYYYSNLPESLEIYVNNYEVTTAGWYTFQQVFYDNGSGALAVDMNLLDSSGNIVFTETRSYPSDVILNEIGGIRFGWFTFINVDGGIKIDETELFINCP